jgi:hypothetical protein
MIFFISDGSLMILVALKAVFILLSSNNLKIALISMVKCAKMAHSCTVLGGGVDFLCVSLHFIS